MQVQQEVSDHAIAFVHAYKGAEVDGAVPRQVLTVVVVVVVAGVNRPMEDPVEIMVINTGAARHSLSCPHLNLGRPVIHTRTMATTTMAGSPTQIHMETKATDSALEVQDEFNALRLKPLLTLF